MPTNAWLGTAKGVSQIDTIQITAFDATTTYQVTIGGFTVSVLGTVDAATTAAALHALLLAETQAYFAAATIAWTVVTDTITATATVPGMPFILATAVVGGAGTIADVQSTVSSGPNHYDTLANWSLGVLPIAGDDIALRANSVPILFGLSQAGATFARFIMEQSYTGKLGLNSSKFAITATSNSEFAEEYRDIYLRIDATLVDLGEDLGPGGLAVGASRVMLDLGGVVSTVTVHNTSSAPAETNRPSIRILAANANTEIFVRNARAGVGVAMDAPGETSTINRVSVSDVTTATRIFLGDGVTMTAYDQNGGDAILNSAVDIPTVTVNNGILTTEGVYEIAVLNSNGGTIFPNNTDPADAIGILNLNGGLVDGRNSNEPRTWGTVNQKAGGTLAIDTTVVSITSHVPTGGEITLAAS